MEEYNELDIVGAEVYQILNLMPEEKYAKVPKKLIELFNKYKNINVELDFDMKKSFKEQNINQKTKDIMFKIAFDYWLTDEERKKSVEKMKLNEEKVREKYNIEKIFEEEKKDTEQTALIVKRENIFTKIFSKIKSFFSNSKK